MNIGLNVMETNAQSTYAHSSFANEIEQCNAIYDVGSNIFISPLLTQHTTYYFAPISPVSHISLDVGSC